jgi:propanol-preferring alcohol dehydrogenase
MEKEVKSAANVTRRDVQEFLVLAAQIPLRPDVQTIPLTKQIRLYRKLSRATFGAQRC